MPHAMAADAQRSHLAINALGPKPEVLDIYQPRSTAMVPQMNMMDAYAHVAQMQMAAAASMAPGAHTQLQSPPSRRRSDSDGSMVANGGGSGSMSLHYGAPQYLWTAPMYDPLGSSGGGDPAVAAYQAQQVAAAQYLYAPMMMHGMGIPHGLVPGQPMQGAELSYNPAMSESILQSPRGAKFRNRGSFSETSSGGSEALDEGTAASRNKNTLRHKLKLRVQSHRDSLGGGQNKQSTGPQSAGLNSASSAGSGMLSPQERIVVRNNIQKRLKLRMLVKGTISPEEANLSPEDIQEISSQIPLPGNFDAAAAAANMHQLQQQQQQQQQLAQFQMLQQSAMYAQGMMPYSLPYGYQVVYPYSGMPMLPAQSAATTHSMPQMQLYALQEHDQQQQQQQQQQEQIHQGQQQALHFAHQQAAADYNQQRQQSSQLQTLHTLQQTPPSRQGPRNQPTNQSQNTPPSNTPSNRRVAQQNTNSKKRAKISKTDSGQKVESVLQAQDIETIPPKSEDDQTPAQVDEPAEQRADHGIENIESKDEASVEEPTNEESTALIRKIDNSTPKIPSASVDTDSLLDRRASVASASGPRKDVILTAHHHQLTHSDSDLMNMPSYVAPGDRRFSWTLPIPGDNRRFSFSLLSNQLFPFAPHGFLLPHSYDDEKTEIGGEFGESGAGESMGDGSLVLSSGPSSNSTRTAAGGEAGGSVDSKWLWDDGIPSLSFPSTSREAE
ncbi:hypothetical protein DFS34DRAFT_644988 [Phlyctochytrium arcticum]|nr:hypothetical protein DFS34DRAFT_644988 [Phlyctochytrium arcticum]